jgi:DNA repair exonuclease SbcCD ATPase subunit
VQGGIAAAQTRVTGLEQAFAHLGQAAADAADTKRQLGTLKSLADDVTQKVAVLEQQREMVDRAIGRARQLDDVLRDVDAKIHTHEQNAESLDALNTRVTELHALHGDLLARSQEISARHDQIVQTDRELLGRLTGLRDEAEQTVKRFEGDAAQLAQTVEHTTERMARLEQAQPAFDAALRDFAGLRGTHQVVKDALERMRLTEGEIGRVREAQAGTKAWLTDVTESVEVLRGELAAVEQIKPTVESVRRDADRLSHAMAQIESRRQLVEQLNTRLSDLTATAAQLDERTSGLRARMDSADQQFQAVTAHATEAARIEKLVPTVIGTVEGAERRMTQMDAAVRALEARAQSLEGLAEETRALARDLELRRTALDSATEHLERASELRAEAATIARQLGERAGQVNGALTGATDRTAALSTTLDDLESRAGNLRFVHKRMAEFEEHLAKWHASQAQLMQALEHTAQRQATVDALQADLYRLFEVAQRTVDHVRAIAAANTRPAKSA